MIGCQAQHKRDSGDIAGCTGACPGRQVDGAASPARRARFTFVLGLAPIRGGGVVRNLAPPPVEDGSPAGWQIAVAEWRDHSYPSFPSLCRNGIRGTHRMQQWDTWHPSSRPLPAVRPRRWGAVPGERRHRGTEAQRHGAEPTRRWCVANGQTMSVTPDQVPIPSTHQNL